MALTDKLIAIANAIRGKTGGSSPLTLDEMASSIGTLSDTSTVTATASDVLTGKTIVGADGQPIDGSMTNNGAKTGTISTKTGSYTIPVGYHNGSGKVTLSSTAKNQLIASNIVAGKTIMGVTGTGGGCKVELITHEIGSGEQFYFQVSGFTITNAHYVFVIGTGYDFGTENNTLIVSKYRICLMIADIKNNTLWSAFNPYSSGAPYLRSDRAHTITYSNGTLTLASNPSTNTIVDGCFENFYNCYVIGT